MQHIPSQASVVAAGASTEEASIIDKLRSTGVLEASIATEITALWKYGVERVHDTAVRAAVADYLTSEAPLIFFVGPASMAGEHHPYWQNRKAGIVRNTVECCLVVDRQLQVYPQFVDAHDNILSGARDVVLAATILSDTFKFGSGDSTSVDENTRYDPTHGAKAADKWRLLAARHMVDSGVADQIYEAIYWHLGRWTPGWKPGMTSSAYAHVTHCVDMFMSDKNLELLYDPKKRIVL
jgi:hypothetical protein